MSADKRTVSTDALETLGMIHTREEKRDAIHLAVIPVEAGQSLAPGAHVYLSDGKAYVCHAYGEMAIGIVDPFLKVGYVDAGQRFWLVIYPRVITSLRHVWTHPSIPDEVGVPAVSTDAKRSEEWLRNYAASSPFTYDEWLMIGRGAQWENGGYGRGYEKWDEYLIVVGNDASGGIDGNVWRHLETLTGVPQLDRPNYFSCTC